MDYSELKLAKKAYECGKAEALSQEPCTDAQERYEDLCEYFGDAKDILKSRKDFKAWLERIKWHIHKAEELYEKYEHKQEPCDAVSRGDARMMLTCEIKDGMTITEYIKMVDKRLRNLPSVRPQEQTGHWIFDDECKEHGHCSFCGYGSVDLTNGEPHKFCRNCGARMVEQQESCEKCLYAEETDGNHCYECVKGESKFKPKERNDKE